MVQGLSYMGCICWGGIVWIGSGRYGWIWICNVFYSCSAIRDLLGISLSINNFKPVGGESWLELGVLEIYKLDLLEEVGVWLGLVIGDKDWAEEWDKDEFKLGKLLDGVKDDVGKIIMSGHSRIISSQGGMFSLDSWSRWEFFIWNLWKRKQRFIKLYVSSIIDFSDNFIKIYVTKMEWRITHENTLFGMKREFIFIVWVMDKLHT